MTTKTGREEFVRKTCENIIFEVILTVMKSKEFAHKFKTSDEKEIEAYKKEARRKSEKISHSVLQKIKEKGFFEHDMSRKELRGIIKECIKTYLTERDGHGTDCS